MTIPKPTTEDSKPSTGSIRTGLAVVAMIVMLSLGTTVTALAGGGGIGTGGGGGGGGQSGGDRYEREWDSFSAKDKRWAHKTSKCEAGPGEDPNIHSPGRDYHGAFQFLKSTWEAAPWSKGSDPHKYSWKVQAVVAVKWMHKAGKGQWPVCG